MTSEVARPPHTDAPPPQPPSPLDGSEPNHSQASRGVVLLAFARFSSPGIFQMKQSEEEEEGKNRTVN